MLLPPPFVANTEMINAIIETPGGSSNKFEYDPATGLFKFGKTLPFGTVFPAAFGFIPGTKGEDGDPLDILILIEDKTFPGCWIECRLIGVIGIAQKDARKKKWQRNDRFIGVPAKAEHFSGIKDIHDINKKKVNELSSFLNYYKI